ncbi:Mob1/phocein, partial [Mycena sp. CBHHK59/15]
MAAQLQRPLRGSRISTFYPVKSLPSLASLDSAFQLQEYISLLIRLDVHDVDAIVSVPGRGKQKGKEKEKEKEGEGAADDGKERKTEVTVDEACWKYEQLRRLAQDLSHPLITMLQQECTRTTCPEMKAGEWLYLCVAHGNDGAMEQCCAIDYILHTLDSATALLNSPRAFPSRLQIPPTSHRHFTSLARRLGRIFAHAYFHHREAFEQAEAESSLYARFLALTEKFDLVPADFLVIPPRALAQPGERRGSLGPHTDVAPPTLLGAALHVDTKSASPPGLDDSLNPRKYGRSRTDTMML